MIHVYTFIKMMCECQQALPFLIPAVTELTYNTGSQRLVQIQIQIQVSNHSKLSHYTLHVEQRPDSPTLEQVISQQWR